MDNSRVQNGGEKHVHVPKTPGTVNVMFTSLIFPYVSLKRLLREFGVNLREILVDNFLYSPQLSAS